ncbi:hypothetical protein SDC9_07984 [bioreactor metagenome]|uniref:Protein-export membrane protein SecG n=1 Tax=bioreactor metagenome TaxID=1076179 RepID=A0A644T6B8_9ZZZZ|nr:preprotein translocase subunit SecG [Candidatus Elulimicrobiales bacterium]
MNWLFTAIAIISILLIVLVLLQKANTDGAGLGGGDSMGMNNKKRGLEKKIFQFTILVVVLFVTFNMIAILAR